MRIGEEAGLRHRTHSHPPSSVPRFTLSAQRRSEGAASCAHQGAPKGSRRVVGGWGTRRGSALWEEHLGPLRQGAATRRAGAAQVVEGRGGTLLAERALAGPWGGRTAERAACAIKGTGPG